MIKICLTLYITVKQLLVYNKEIFYNPPECDATKVHC